LTGENICLIMPNLVGQRLNEQFDLQRPAVNLTYEGVRTNRLRIQPPQLLAHLNCMFQMESLFPVQKPQHKEAITFKVNEVIEDKVEVEGR